MAYARGRHTQAICDRCGFQYHLLQLKKEWNGLRVCPECWEPKHPQLEIKSKYDPQAVRDPRPNNHQREDVNVLIRPGLTMTGFVGEALGVQVNDGVTVTGYEITSALGDPVETVDPVVSGVVATGNTPTVGITVNDAVQPAGLASVTALGTVTVALDSNGWGFDTWGNGAWGE